MSAEPTPTLTDTSGTLGGCCVRSARSTCSRAAPYRGNPVAVVLDADGLTDRADAALRPLDEPVRDDVRAAADATRRRLPRADLHPVPRAALRRPPDAGHLPRLARGRRRPARRRRDRAGVRRRPGPGAPRPPTASPSPRRRCVRSRPGRRATLVARVAALLGIERADASSPPSGSTTGRAGSPCCSTTPTPCSPLQPARHRRRRRRRRRPAPAAARRRPSRSGRSSPRTG